MAVDWSIFWNNIFPGLVLIISSSIGAYCVVHRYQRKKYNKEIRDNLIHQEHKLLNKYYDLTGVFYELMFLDIQPSTKIRKMISELNKRIKDYSKEIMDVSKEIKEREKIEKKIEETEKELSQLNESLNSLSGQFELIIKFTTVIYQFVLDTHLLYNRLLAQLGINKETLNFFLEFLDKFDAFSKRMFKIIREDGWGKHKESLTDQLSSLSGFFEDIEEVILTSKIKFK